MNLLNYSEKNDFILFTEIWANDLCDLQVDGFSLFQLNRKNRKYNAKRDSGGIALYVKSDINQYCKLLTKVSDDIIWIKN